MIYAPILYHSRLAIFGSFVGPEVMEPRKSQYYNRYNMSTYVYNETCFAGMSSHCTTLYTIAKTNHFWIIDSEYTVDYIPNNILYYFPLKNHRRIFENQTRICWRQIKRLPINMVDHLSRVTWIHVVCRSNSIVIVSRIHTLSVSCRAMG